MPKRRARPRDCGKFEDEPYIDWLEEQPCRACGHRPCGVAHHLRHDENGASLGAMIKDDRRAISLCWRCHGERHDLAGRFSGWTNTDVQAWENERLAAQRSAYLVRLEVAPAVPF